jgi:hypothetical protein
MNVWSIHQVSIKGACRPRYLVRSGTCLLEAHTVFEGGFRDLLNITILPQIQRGKAISGFKRIETGTQALFKAE